MPRGRSELIARGDVYDADVGGVGVRPVVVITRDSAIPVLTSLVCVMVTSSVHGHVAEVELGHDEGLDHACAANCDYVFTLPRSVLTRRRGRLGPVKLEQLDTALRIALGLV